MAAEPQFCKTDRDGHLLIVTINRPEVLNALHTEAHREIAGVFDRFARDPELWCAILTGAGPRAFSTGNDLKAQAAGQRTVLPDTGFCGLTTRFDLNKPVIAAVNGLAFGGGFEAALACDILIAEDHASFALPEPLVGTAATSGGVVRLMQEVPRKQAMGIVLTGRRVDAQEGKAMGFVTEVVPRGEGLEAARHWAGRILACAPLAVRATKAIAADVFRGQSLADQLAHLPPEVGELRASADYLEGPIAFRDKRPPRWAGR